jgi:hypothetical protein
LIYEIRNYHFDPARFEEYKAWAKSAALPYLQRELDLVGFWATAGETEITGAPMDDLGSANITWIIRWPNRATRDEEFPKRMGTDEWAKIFADVPGGIESYKRMEAKFTEALI